MIYYVFIMYLFRTYYVPIMYLLYSYYVPIVYLLCNYYTHNITDMRSIRNRLQGILRDGFIIAKEARASCDTLGSRSACLIYAMYRHMSPVFIKYYLLILYIYIHSHICIPLGNANIHVVWHLVNCQHTPETLIVPDHVYTRIYICIYVYKLQIILLKYKCILVYTN